MQTHAPFRDLHDHKMSVYGLLASERLCKGDTEREGWREREYITAHIMLLLLLLTEHVLQPPPRSHFNRPDLTRSDRGKVFGAFLSALISYTCFPHEQASEVNTMLSR